MRGHNEGSVYPRTVKRAAGTVTLWVAAVSTPHGRRTAYARTEREARHKLADLKRRRDEGLDLRRSMTLGTYLDGWLADIQSSIRPTTFQSYRLHVSHLRDGLGRVPLTGLSVEAVNAYLRSLDCAPQTALNRRAVLRHALKDAQGRRLVSLNVAAHSAAPKVERRPSVTLDASQAALLLRSSSEDRLYPLWALALFTGQRESELLGLTWPNVDLDTGTIRIEHRLAREGREWVLVPPKTAGSRHPVPLGPIAVAALRAWREAQSAEHGRDWYDGLVFTTPAGMPLHATDVLEAWHGALERAGLPRMRFHDIRHTAASIALGAGYTLEDVKQLLGHSTITLTSDTYAAPLTARQRTVTSGLEEAVSSAAERAAEWSVRQQK